MSRSRTTFEPITDPEAGMIRAKSLSRRLLAVPKKTVADDRSKPAKKPRKK